MTKTKAKKAERLKKFTFSENNSGGRWWLKMKQYKALFKAGWKYEADEYDQINGYDTKPWLGDTEDAVPYGWRHNTVGSFANIKEAIKSWEQATGRDFFDQGCNCCGAPFSMSGGEGKDHEYLSGDSVERNAVRPW